MRKLFILACTLLHFGAVLAIEIVPSESVSWDRREIRSYSIYRNARLGNIDNGCLTAIPYGGKPHPSEMAWKCILKPSKGNDVIRFSIIEPNDFHPLARSVFIDGLNLSKSSSTTLSRNGVRAILIDIGTNFGEVSVSKCLAGQVSVYGSGRGNITGDRATSIRIKARVVEPAKEKGTCKRGPLTGYAINETFSLSFPGSKPEAPPQK